MVKYKSLKLSMIFKNPVYLFYSSVISSSMEKAMLCLGKAFSLCSKILLHFCCIMLHCACIAWLLPVGTFGGTPPSKHLSVSTSALYNKRSTDLATSSGNLSARERPAESMMGKGVSVCLSFSGTSTCCTYTTPGLSKHADLLSCICKKGLNFAYFQQRSPYKSLVGLSSTHTP